MIPTLRVARATNDLSRAVDQYRDGLGLTVLGEFRDHENFSGAMLGFPGGPYHLEFTTETGTTAPGPAGPESLLVLYLEDPSEHSARVAQAVAHGFTRVPAHNPYWERNGVTLADFEGHRVVLALGRYPP